MTDADGHFLDHFIKEKVPDDSTMSSSQALALQVFEWCTEYGVSDTLEFIAGDSTNSNTGYKGVPGVPLPGGIPGQKTVLDCVPAAEAEEADHSERWEDQQQGWVGGRAGEVAADCQLSGENPQLPYNPGEDKSP